MTAPGLPIESERMDFGGNGSPFIEWESEFVSEKMQDVLAPAPTDNDAKSAREVAREFLQQELTKGVVSVKDLRRSATQAGLKWDNVSKARYDLNIIAERRHFDGGWQWSMPKVDTTPSPSPKRPPWGENSMQVVDSAQDGSKVDTFQKRPPSSTLVQPHRLRADLPPKMDTVHLGEGGKNDPASVNFTDDDDLDFLS